MSDKTIDRRTFEALLHDSYAGRDEGSLVGTRTSYDAVLETLNERLCNGEYIAVYRNADLGSADVGALTFFIYNDVDTRPGGASPKDWRYTIVGYYERGEKLRKVSLVDAIDFGRLVVDGAWSDEYDQRFSIELHSYAEWPRLHVYVFWNTAKLALPLAELHVSATAHSYTTGPSVKARFDRLGSVTWEIGFTQDVGRPDWSRNGAGGTAEGLGEAIVHGYNCITQGLLKGIDPKLVLAATQVGR